MKSPSSGFKEKTEFLPGLGQLAVFTDFLEFGVQRCHEFLRLEHEHVTVYAARNLFCMDPIRIRFSPLLCTERGTAFYRRC